MEWVKRASGDALVAVVVEDRLMRIRPNASRSHSKNIDVSFLAARVRAELLLDLELVAPTGVAYGAPFDPVGAARCNPAGGSCLCVERYNRVPRDTVCKLVQLEWQRARGPRVLKGAWMQQFDAGMYKCPSGNTCMTAHNGMDQPDVVIGEAHYGPFWEPAPGRVIAMVALEALTSRSYYQAQHWDRLVRMGAHVMSYRPPRPQNADISASAAAALQHGYMTLSYSDDPLWRYTTPPPEPFAKRDSVFVIYSHCMPQRQHIIDELSRHLSVDVFGRCNPNRKLEDSSCARLSRGRSASQDPQKLCLLGAYASVTVVRRSTCSKGCRDRGQRRPEKERPHLLQPSTSLCWRWKILILRATQRRSCGCHSLRAAFLCVRARSCPALVTCSCYCAHEFVGTRGAQVLGSAAPSLSLGKAHG